MWLYNGVEFNPETDIEKNIGFVYKITNLDNGKIYIGKKLFEFTRTKKVKGKRKKVKKESDWESYYGSNETLQEDVERLGQDRFKREILKLCKTKGTCSYWETYEIMARHAIISDDYYNEWVQCKISRSHIKE